MRIGKVQQDRLQECATLVSSLPFTDHNLAAVSDELVHLAQHLCTLLGRGERTHRDTLGAWITHDNLLCDARTHGLDDITVELLKAVLLRGGFGALGDHAELRLADATPRELSFEVVDTTRGRSIETLAVPRELYDEVAARGAGLDELRREPVCRPEPTAHRDLNRLLVATRSASSRAPTGEAPGARVAGNDTPLQAISTLPKLLF